MGVSRRGILVGLVAAAAPALAQQEGDSAFPSRPVRLIVPFPPGGAADILARGVAEQLRLLWEQPVVVENQSGAGGNIGAATFARAEPDGYTLMSSPPGPLAINQSLYRQLPFDPTSFVPITVIAKVPNVVAVNPALGIGSLRDLIARAKAQPGQMTFASQGSGSTSHLTAALFEFLTGTRLIHVPYRGEAPALTDLIAGQVDMMFGNLTAALPQHQAGRLRILAITDEARSTALPEVPTAAEAGLPGLRSTAWFAVVAPPGTPGALAERISATVVKALRAPQLRERYRELGAEPVGRPPAETAAFIQEESRRWGEVIRTAGVTLD